eukprot:6183541-Pleurochrysis_carterae.AAC.1
MSQGSRTSSGSWRTAVTSIAGRTLRARQASGHLKLVEASNRVITNPVDRSSTGAHVQTLSTHTHTHTHTARSHVP